MQVSIRTKKIADAKDRPCQRTVVVNRIMEASARGGVLLHDRCLKGSGINMQQNAYKKGKGIGEKPGPIVTYTWITQDLLGYSELIGKPENERLI